MKRVENKIALVVAATRGIGLACATELAKEGAKVFIGVRRMDAGEEAAKEIRAAGGWAKPVYFDASKEESYASMIDTVLAESGQLDILVNNYGGTDRKQDRDLVHTPIDAWMNGIRTNLNSVFIPCQIAIPHMAKHGGGSIVNISSIASISTNMSGITYNSAKRAINALTQNIAVQYARFNIRCNAVLPGLIATEAVANNMPNSFVEEYLKGQPLQRLGQPEDIARAVLFFASEESSFITGQLLPVSGGKEIATTGYGAGSDVIEL